MKRTSCTQVCTHNSPKKLQIYNNYIQKEKESENSTTERASM